MSIDVYIQDYEDNELFFINGAYQFNAFFVDIIRQRHKEFGDSIEYQVFPSDLFRFRNLAREVLEFKRKAKVLLPNKCLGFIGQNIFDNDYFWQLEEIVKFIDKFEEEFEGC